MQIGVLGSGSWATALAKILTDNKHPIHWWIRQESLMDQLKKRKHNPQYLPSVQFDLSLLQLTTDIREVVGKSDLILLATPSAYLPTSLEGLSAKDWKGKKVLSAIKGLIPQENTLVNHYLQNKFGLPLDDYFTLLGPCHAEEVAEEKLSYLTFSGIDTAATQHIASYFATDYINTITNQDISGAQYAAALKNIYAVGAGIAHGLDYGDNFLSVYIANAADEMASFLRQFGEEHITVGVHQEEDPITHRKRPNYAASVYLGDLLVTCYSPHSRNRRFGKLIGRGYSVKAAQLEVSMVAEGYTACRCIYAVNQQDPVSIPIAEMVYKICWEGVGAEEGFKQLEPLMM
ncbi:MAG: glycerol-3-phosphate dehydrogenase [Bacteroidetes bacterium]|nr:glycerol-3-phosphate dehydrogenase [Bacteroidota bacterium]